MFAYDHFWLTSIQFRRFAAFFFFNSLFSFDHGVIPVFVLNFAVSNSGGKMTTNRKYNCRQSTATVFRFFGLFVYVVYCILRHSDVIPVIFVIPVILYLYAPDIGSQFQLHGLYLINDYK